MTRGMMPPDGASADESHRLRMLFMRAGTVALLGEAPGLAEFLENQGFRVVLGEPPDIVVVVEEGGLEAGIEAARTARAALWVEPSAAVGDREAARARLEGAELVWNRSIREEYTGQFLSTCSA